MRTLGLGISLAGSSGGGSAIWTPAQQSGLISWGKLSDAGVVLNGGNVVSVPDRANASNTFQQNTAGNQPLFVASAINGKPAMRTQASGSKLLVGTLATHYSLSTITFICVGNPTFAASGRIFSMFPTGGNDTQSGAFTVFQAAATTETFYSNGVVGSSTIPTTASGAPGVYSVRLDGATARLRLSGVDGGGGAFSTALSVDNWTLNGTAAFETTLDACEWAIISHALSTAEWAQWSAYTTNLYGLAA